MIQIGARALRELADLLEAVDAATKDSQITITGHSWITIPGSNVGSSGDGGLVLGLTFSGPLNAHVVEFPEG